MTFQDTNTLGLDVVYQVVYGSKLYGTNTPTSDTDLKSIYLPTIDDMLLGKKLAVHKSRVDAHGKPVPEGEPMPDSGVENEYIPFQTFVRDFVQESIVSGWVQKIIDHHQIKGVSVAAFRD